MNLNTTFTVSAVQAAARTAAWADLTTPLRCPVCTENLNPNIVVMKPTEDRVCFDRPYPLNRTRGWGILVQ